MCPDEGHSTARSIITRTAKAISDGSYKDRHDTSAAMLDGDNFKQAIKTVNRVPGPSHQQSSYRSKLAGINMILTHTMALCTFHDIWEGLITIGLDGKQAMLNCQKEHLDTSDPDFDMICDIQGKMQRLPIEVVFKWIKGHQDKHRPDEFLDVWAQFNILADSIAKQHMQNTSDQYEGWSVFIDSYKLTRIKVKDIYCFVVKDKTQRYWQNKFEISPQVSSYVNWDILGKAFKSLWFAKQRRLLKHITDKAPTGNNMKKWKFWESDSCPSCDHQENSKHVLTCQDAHAQERLSVNITHLKLWLLKAHTAPVITA